jgi:hypothetical protein
VATGETLLKRLTLLVDDGVVSHVWYPVFPPDTHAVQVLDFLRSGLIGCFRRLATGVGVVLVPGVTAVHRVLEALRVLVEVPCVGTPWVPCPRRALGAHGRHDTPWRGSSSA